MGAIDLRGDEEFLRRSCEPSVTVGLGFPTTSLERVEELKRSCKSLEA